MNLGEPPRMSQYL